MHWQALGDYLLSNQWQATPHVKAELFKVTSLSTPAKQDYVKGAIAQGIEHEGILSLYLPQRLNCRQEKEIFLFKNIDDSPKSIVFKRIDKLFEIDWIIRIEYTDNMLITSNKSQVTQAVPLPDISITNSKKLVIPENKNSERKSYLISNNSTQSVYFKYVPLGVDATNESVTISASNYDFIVASGDSWIDTTLTQNGVVGIAQGLNPNVKIKAIEYLYL